MFSDVDSFSIARGKSPWQLIFVDFVQIVVHRTEFRWHSVDGVSTVRSATESNWFAGRRRLVAQPGWPNVRLCHVSSLYSFLTNYYINTDNATGMDRGRSEWYRVPYRYVVRIRNEIRRTTTRTLWLRNVHDDFITSRNKPQFRCTSTCYMSIRTPHAAIALTTKTVQH